MSKQKRLIGLDLCRGLAAYAVILVHSGDETWGVPIEKSAISFRLLFYFAVPFFLSAAFYFMARKPNAGLSLDFWKSRLERLVVPYLVWSTIYLALRSIFFSTSNQFHRFIEILQDPLSMAFFGGTSYHLYFLPLLLAGSTLTLLSTYFSERFGVKLLLVLSTISIVVDIAIKLSGNGFQLGPDVAFTNLSDLFSVNLNTQPLIRLVLVYVFWVLECLPYFLIGIVLNRAFLTVGFLSLFDRSKTIFVLLIFLVINIFGGLLLPQTVKDIVAAYSLLLFGIFISKYLNEADQHNPVLGNIATSLGLSSFGIYLIHPILMNFTKLFFSKLGATGQITILSMLAISSTTFFLSWIVVSQMLKRKWVAKYVFGV
jgi:peptidoglycan/LPS O-acetylase OafA/YrhL